MGQILNCRAAFACNPYAAPDPRQYLWFADTTLAGINAQRVAVAALIAGGFEPTGYAQATELPAAALSGYPFGTTVWCFCVAETVSKGFTLASDTASKNVED